MGKGKNYFKDKDYEEKLEFETKNKRICKNCKYTTLIPGYKKRILCKRCGHWVFRNDKDEFEFRKDEQKYEFKRRMKEQLNRK